MPRVNATTVEGLILDAGGPVATITFDRPAKANYIDNEWIEPLRAFFVEVAGRTDVRCVVLQANGRHFMAGGDLNYHDELMAMKPAERLAPLLALIERWNAMLKALLAVPQPIVARVQGGVVGASFGLVMACDLVIAAESAFFVVAHALHGGAIDGLVTYFLPRQVGYKKAMQLCLLGRRIGAREAERLGIVSEVVADELLASETDRLVQQLSEGPTRAYGMIKELVMTSLEHSLEEQATLENLRTAASAMTRDWEEGSDAVFRKRKPVFTGT
jgi:2-(1,2-epoxy-1,2-dihydrophenyl)acetyl-CoA isomerase